MYNSILLYAADGDAIPDERLDEYEILPLDAETHTVLYVRVQLRLGDVGRALDSANPYPWETVLNTVPYALAVEFDEREELHEGHVQRD